MLELDAINAGYGRAQILRDVSLTVAPGEILCLLGRNGAGKTTTMKAIMGLLPLMSGAVRFKGEPISDLPAHRIPGLGIGYVPQGRRLFGELTVAQNLEIGLMVRRAGRDTLEDVLGLFPRLRERMQQRADTLSGGEQQMLAMARALCLEPELLLMDEPTEGLQPSMIEAIRQVVVLMRDRGTGILLVEQRVDAVLSIADRVAFIENGRNVDTLDASALRADHSLIERHLGV
ncbi:ABC transporter ATP-binding protein [Jhaorihella thermophila]|uniref:Branched-chain amino acid transport system ATP-binding protein n=1 Tax=Jhaorihella thermophila TaxID=488547 RepID=A0A1H5T5C3_9RHOB|nr:ABC transporter ATP-binding protein [Jhaorihella thermophila]SEF57358.1 branched-chain amino acid transport system ATP-binding protein [Jhaorihella thermophila]